MIGVSSLCMLQSDLQNVLDTVIPTFSHVEVICEGNHTNLEVLLSYDCSVSFHAPFSDLNIMSLNRAILAESLSQISETVEIAATYNAEAVCIHPGHFSPLGMHFPEKVRAIQRESLSTLARAAEDQNVKLGVENMPVFPILSCRTPQEMGDLIRAVDSEYLGITFDMGHANTTGTVKQFLDLKEYMVLVHLHDNSGDEDSHLALGDGNTNLDFVKELKDKRLIIEVNAYPDAVKSLQYLRDRNF
ncbi:MAG: sugar phosphate isomerase/epimerase [Theionarchaea archaeon]|nr:sugar phosphate isomerase/epimerase [Theionarchaea archaeon]MBU7001080.1 sugar phosphate isomerase/epimerase [Theionarchaea archaeon]MBU7020569.1 sugar phosphate isomerase/epimerase [Theionarchaea archaeon]MBU7034218.1 sugar phosphate isomerase/epimerase [Theionarchaea archaeon]MBU7039292.1 sugar phosphate isomerase/epimerase [Theionarchaea archaeon]